MSHRILGGESVAEQSRLGLWAVLALQDGSDEAATQSMVEVESMTELSGQTRLTGTGGSADEDDRLAHQA
jgi:hypothetical protein